MDTLNKDVIRIIVRFLDNDSARMLTDMYIQDDMRVACIILNCVIDDLMKERHQQFSEIMKMPIPLVNEIIKRIDKERKDEKKEIDKMRRKR